MKPMAATELNRQTKDLRRWIGRQILEQRLDSGVTQQQLAACAGIDQGHLSRLERGQATPSIETLIQLSRCLGSEVGIRLYPTSGPRLHDRFQAPIVNALVEYIGDEWMPRPEVAVPAARGVIDLVLMRALDKLTVACECHSEIRRLEAVLRRSAEKADALRAQVGSDGTVSSLLLLRSTRATREVATAFEATLRAAFPARTAHALEALLGRSAWPGPAIVWARVEGGKATILEGAPRGIRLGR